MTGVSECSQQRGNLKDDGYNHFSIHFTEINLYNTAKFRVEWFQLIDLLNTEELQINRMYTLWISRCIATARKRIPESIANYVTGVSECSQQRGKLKDNGYINSHNYMCLHRMSSTPLVLNDVAQRSTPHGICANHKVGDSLFYPIKTCR
ncbi:hypothetical protein [Photorhabdus laumondii]|uniref:hypothetical protein n=1 Tax=Photorhabdus laumondii TaxID=2218628 RepID=UPI0025B0BAA3|nr:hypothetical protein [Photorhabdus laumondii]